MTTVDSESNSDCKAVSGFPFGNTAMDGDTGLRYQSGEIHVVRDFVDTHVWRIYLTGQQGKLPQRPLLDKPEGEPLSFETRADALAHAHSVFQTVGSLELGVPFHYKGRQYMRIAIPNWKVTKNFVPVLNLESFSVSEMHGDCKPTPEEQPQCGPSSSVVASSQPAS